MSISNYLENEILDHIFGGGSRDYTAPATVYVQLHTGDPGEDGTSDVSAETTRKALTGDTHFTAAASGQIDTQTQDLEWTSWSAGTETISHISVWDNSAGGNCLWYGALTASKTVNNGDTFRISAGNLSFTLD